LVDGRLPATGVRRRIKVDLREISIVTFPMLPQARVANVKGAGMNARLASAIERGALAMSGQTKGYAANAGADESRLAKAIHAGADILRGYMRPVDPDQARDAQDPGGETANDSDGDAQNSSPAIIPVQSDGSGRYFIDLAQEEVLGGHTIQEHVGKSDEYLKNRVNDFQNENRKPPFYAGTFTSIGAATKLVNATIAKYPTTVAAVASGLMSYATLDASFGSPTGQQAIGLSNSGSPYMDDTYGVKVIIVYDPNLLRGFKVHTAYPTSQ